MRDSNAKNTATSTGPAAGEITDYYTALEREKLLRRLEDILAELVFFEMLEEQDASRLLQRVGRARRPSKALLLTRFLEAVLGSLGRELKHGRHFVEHTDGCLAVNVDAALDRLQTTRRTLLTSRDVWQALRFGRQYFPHVITALSVPAFFGRRCHRALIIDEERAMRFVDDTMSSRRPSTPSGRARAVPSR